MATASPGASSRWPKAPWNSTRARSQSGNSLWHPRPDGAQDSRHPRPAAWLRHRPAHRAGGRKLPGTQPGHHLSRPPPPRTERLDFEPVGRQREQPQGPLLLHHPRRTQTTRRRSQELVPHRGDDGPPPGERIVTPLRVLLSRLLGKGRNPADLDSEIAAHLSLLAADYQRRGLSPADALTAARRHFGPITQLHETYRAQRRLPFLDSFAQDLTYALRQLRRNPGFAAAAVLTLALGIGANAAIYQVLDAVAFRSLPVRDPASLGKIQLLKNTRPIHISSPFYRELAARQQVLDGLFAVSDFPLRQAVL